MAPMMSDVLPSTVSIRAAPMRCSRPVMQDICRLGEIPSNRSLGALPWTLSSPKAAETQETVRVQPLSDASSPDGGVKNRTTAASSRITPSPKPATAPRGLSFFGAVERGVDAPDAEA